MRGVVCHRGFRGFSVIVPTPLYGYFMGLILFSWVFCGSKIFSRWYFMGPKCFSCRYFIGPVFFFEWLISRFKDFQLLNFQLSNSTYSLENALPVSSISGQFDVQALSFQGSEHSPNSQFLGAMLTI